MTAMGCNNAEYVILVDQHDNPIGTEEKITAHQKNLLHRAFSVFVFRTHPTLEILLQQRALHKYHSPGLWTNTCCSHPRVDEDIVKAGERRLLEEFGFHTTLKNVGWFHYNTHFDNGLSENENDHVLIGTLADDTQITPNPDEIHTYRFITPSDLEREMAANPKQFTSWLPKALAMALHAMQSA